MNDFYTQAERLQDLLISRATGEDCDPAEFSRLRLTLISNPKLKQLLPEFIHTCRDPSQFWHFISRKHGGYAERRAFIWEQFRPLLSALEGGDLSPSDHSVTDTLKKVDATHVQAAWLKALDRRSSDPEGAITSARTLIEAVCKHILEDAKVDYNDKLDLQKLYQLTAETLKLAPSQHTEKVFKQILGGCTAVVEGIGSLRNRLSDAHGKGSVGSRPAPRHADLVVNLSGTLASFLLATWEARNDA